MVLFLIYSVSKRKLYTELYEVTKNEKRPSAQGRSFHYTNSKLDLNVYFKSFKMAIASVALDNCAYFKAVNPFSFLADAFAPFFNKTLMISTLL